MLTQELIIAAVGMEKGEAELTIAARFIDLLDWPGRVLTGDALFCQRGLCRQVWAAGSYYPVALKANRPALLADLQLFFDPPTDEPARLQTDLRTARTVHYRHGRILGLSALTASAGLTADLASPHLVQVLRIEHSWREHGTTKRCMTTRSPACRRNGADGAVLLRLKRGHWAIENGLHWAKGRDLAGGSHFDPCWPRTASHGVCCATSRSTCAIWPASSRSPPPFATSVAISTKQSLTSSTPRHWHISPD